MIKNLKKNPFAVYSAEEELGILNEIYYEPIYYNELKDLLSQGVSRFILGQRGQGKSATIYKLFKDLSSNHTLPVLITRYDSIPLTKNENHLLYIIMQSLTMEMARHTFHDESKLKQLSKIHRGQFSLFIEMFYDPSFSSVFMESASTIRDKKRKNIFVRFFNQGVLKLLNSIANGAVNITSLMVRQAIGADTTNLDTTFRNYFSEIPTKEINSMGITEIAQWDRDRLIRMLHTLIEIARSMNFNSIVVLFDKIDEFQAVNSDVDKVADFAVEILSDTDLLYSEHLSIVFSLWSEVKRSLNRRGIRFDKFKEIDIRWQAEDLEPLIDRKLKFYSKDQNNPVTLKQLMPDDNDRRTTLELADRSPRALIRLLAEIYNLDHRHEASESFDTTAISNGFIRFCKTFDYDSQNPSRSGKSNDLVLWINRLLRIRRDRFSIEDINTAFSQRTNISFKHLEQFQKLGLVREYYLRTEQDQPIFEIIDPKVRFLISRGVLELDQ